MDNHTNRRQTGGGDELCKDEKPKEEMKELLMQCSQLEDMDSQDLISDSPILFSSQKSGDKKKDEESDEDSDCYEIVDKISLEKDTNVSRNTRYNDRLRLTRKRPIYDQLGNDSHTSSDNKSSKQRRVEKNDDLLNNMKITDDDKVQPFKNLTRVYRYPNCVCQTIKDAEDNNLFFAPRHMNPALYKAVIVRKLENYRRRLRRAQSCLMSFHPHADKGIDPVSVRSRGHAGARVKRTSVVKKIVQESRKQTEKQRVVQVVDAVDRSEAPRMKGEEQTKNNDVVVEKVSSKKSSQGVETSTKTDLKIRTDVVSTTSDVVLKTANNDENNASPVKLVLHTKHRKAILEENGSDDELEKFELKPPVLPEETRKEEEDCVEVSPSTVAKEPSREQQVKGFECPLCYKKFPQDTIEHHASLCNGLDETSTSNNSARTMDIQDGQSSPVIKTRTPTKVKELKLLQKVAQTTKPKESNVDNKDSKRNAERINTIDNKQSKRISLEPSIKLQHVGITGVKCGQSRIKEQEFDIKDNKKNESTPQLKINQTFQQNRLSTSKIRRNLDGRSWDVSTLKRDFIPLEFEKENNKITPKDVHKLLSLTDSNSSESSSEEMECAKIPAAARKKSVDSDADMCALSLLATKYKGGKRRSDESVKSNLKKVKVSASEENDTEHCFLCGKDIPRSEYTEHVNQEILRQQKEDEEKAYSLSVTGCMSQSTQSDGSNVDEVKTRLSLPDLAEGTTRPANDGTDSPLKTFTPLQKGSDYHKQFSFFNDKGQSSGNRGTGRGKREGRRLSVRRKR